MHSSIWLHIHLHWILMCVPHDNTQQSIRITVREVKIVYFVPQECI